MQKPLLTIAIPTYNRNELLCKSLEKLFPQAQDAVCFLIIDNASNISVADSIRTRFGAAAPPSLRVVRNAFNIGGTANALRCLELAETEWMWVLGDDDIVSSDSVEIVLTEIKRAVGCVAINFASHMFRRQQSYSTRGLDGTIAGMDSYSNLMYMASTAYQVSTLRRRLDFGYLYGYLNAHFIPLLFSGLNEDDEVLWSQRQVILGTLQSGIGFSNVLIYLGRYILLDMPMKQTTRVALAKRLRENRLSWRYMLTHLVQKAVMEGSPEEARYYCSQIRLRGRLCDGYIISHFVEFVSWVALRVPVLTLQAMRAVYWLLYRKSLPVVYVRHDHFK
jgi:glycosyltransferase involved in cell wall biosynthesis